MTKIMDLSVGIVVEALEKKNMLKNSIIVFSTDNGGPANGFNFNAASNWPLRGVKDTLFEGMLFYLYNYSLKSLKKYILTYNDSVSTCK
jgi:arylsulfatase A-like enzyme